MSQQPFNVSNVKDNAKQAVKQTIANPWVERLARFGYAAKGVVYIIIGVLAALAAFGYGGGQTTDSQGALQTLLTQPFGKILLGAVALGLVGYALWRLVQAGIDAENKGADAKGLAIRTGYAISGFVHLGLAFTAMQLVLGTGGGGGSNNESQQDWTARVLAQPFGRWLVGIVGIIIIGVGISQLYKAYTAKFREDLNLNQMSATEQLWATRSGKLGFVARGVVFALVGFFVVQAAWRYNPGEVQGIGGALNTLAGGPLGSITFPIVALGLIAYGLFMFVQARYRRINTT